MSAIDNGGAIAIKGFNYQKASIIHVIIHHFEKKNFKVIPESKEDFEIHLDNEIYYVQVKGTKKLSIGKLKSKTSGKASIVEKNMLPGEDSDKRKIFLWDLANTTKSELIKRNGTLVSTVLGFSVEQKQDFISSLNLDENQKNRLNNQFIYITPFSNDLDSALTVLKGEMVTENLLVTNERARVVLGELSLEIDQKSEIIIQTDNDIERKVIQGDYLRRVFANVQQKEMFDEVLNNLSINTIMKRKIRNIKLHIPLLHQNLKEEIKQQVDINLIMNSTDEEAIGYLRGLIATEVDTELSIALAIDCFCELGEV
ncbi:MULTISPECIES: dsDNA nuclease domain-containing protein [unclassified Sporosarcina]|uniref:dsDNA nuclease domain-containing protein n=1 Tax=unclassified Sporosarcina TaxID=2647733 RepID=UPI000C1656DB|nr:MULTISPECIES: dsDNA nuclease domain-containing protein [unclassified Sporosarcina]PID05015.1 hypothetical protein CSV66_11985 [Sporosarcina sp. P30]PID08015.1 hypothetical protein CSV65_13125 [Sporosarcina sp. P31]PID11769.1 hypothetical protein CSV64_10220 [Sporosarcina sp. P32b]